MESGTLIFLLAATLSGLAVGYLIGILRSKGQSREQELERELERAAYELESEKRRILELRVEEEALKSDLERVRLEKEKEAVRSSKLETEKLGLIEQLETHKNEVKAMQEKLNKDFELLANRIFEEKSEKFSMQNRNSLEVILNPLKEKISEFEKKVEETHRDSLKETSGLRQELKTLRDMSVKMTEETENLTRALRNDSKVQGNWGEMILESILESSGLRKNHEYFLQKNKTTEDGRRFQPDVSIRLPEDKWIIIDSKVSLTDYDRYVSESDPDIQKQHLKQHINSIRNHCRGLASKKYPEVAEGKNLDFILMFIPIEPAYLVALNSDQQLFQEAYDKQIVMVSPTTLIASLKIIATTWKHEYQNQNSRDIAERGKLLLEKFYNFTEDLLEIGKNIDRTERSYQGAMNKLKTGRGNLIKQARDLEELGVKSTKKIHEDLLPGSDE